MASATHPAARYRDKATLVQGQSIWTYRAFWTYRAYRAALAIVLAGALAGCDDFTTYQSVAPQTRPQPETAPAPAPRSAESEALARYYIALQNDLLTRGLLRTDGGGPDTEFTADALARNFEATALYEEYSLRASQPLKSTGSSSRLGRWTRPVRINIHFGPSVALAQRQEDQARIVSYANRLSRVTGHPVSAVDSPGNFHVFVVGYDDSAFVRSRLTQLIPDIKQKELGLLTDLPRSEYCAVLAFTSAQATHVYTHSVALIRAEHPDLMRLSCIHEEIAQGLGVANDSPTARPSIFNDDDEFALLTTHDELLLKMLYDPRLSPGMTADQARPIVRVIAHEYMGQPL